MILETAIKNFRRHLAGRVLYLVALALLVMVSYDCLTTFQDSFISRISQGNPALVALLLLFFSLLGFSVLIIFYANRFFIHQHRSEIGLMIISGLSRGQIALIFFLETLFGELLALGFGLLLGLLTNKLFAMLLLRLMGLRAATNHWFSFSALWKTSLGFLIVFALVGIFDSSRIFSLRTVRLLYPNELGDIRQRNSWLNRLLAWLGPLLVIGGYVAVFKLSWIHFMETLRFSDRTATNTVLIMGALILGIWFCFRNTLPALFSWLQGTKWAYDQQRILDLATTGQEVQFHHQSLTLTTLFVTASVVLLGFASVLYSDGFRNLEEEAPIDLVADRQFHDHVLQQIKAKGGHLQRLAHLPVKIMPVTLHGPKSDVIMSQATMPIEIVGMHNYLQIQRHQKNLLPVILDRNQALFISQDFQYQHVHLHELMRNQVQFADGKLPRLQIVAFSRVYPLGSNLFFGNVLVVPDDIFEQIPSANSRVLVGYRLKKIAPDSPFLKKIDDDSYQSKASRQMRYRHPQQLQKAQITIYQDVKRDLSNAYISSNYSVRGPSQVLLQRVLGAIVFVIGLLAILMTFAWASVCSLRELSEVERTRFDYLTLTKIGIDQHHLLRYSNWKNRMLFLSPVIFGIGNGLLVMRFVGLYLNHLPMKLLYLLTAAVFIVYWCFYLFTSYNYRRIIKMTTPPDQQGR
ncbi:FtsX-like permease family protein [Lapidilactobacillus wuchangensis]|uniref:FtsX-like permease family protein n=1 Tax=Lapidilactobacillus wuchangensis TaxID=2486001 RepID=UPI000F79F39B|nr:FtsX-like permease family protein [Lapidilactobacillus wuchangensis]